MSIVFDRYDLIEVKNVINFTSEEWLKGDDSILDWVTLYLVFNRFLPYSFITYFYHILKNSVSYTTCRRLEACCV